MTELPLEAAGFDLVISWNVIYHGDGAVVGAAIGEIDRVMKPGGHYLGTMLTKRNGQFGVGEEVAPDTWVDADGPDDKTHPHFFCDAEGLCRLFTGFEVLELRQDDHGKPGHWHWQLILQKAA